MNNRITTSNILPKKKYFFESILSHKSLLKIDISAYMWPCQDCEVWSHANGLEIISIFYFAKKKEKKRQNTTHVRIINKHSDINLNERNNKGVCGVGLT